MKAISFDRKGAKCVYTLFCFVLFTTEFLSPTIHYSQCFDENRGLKKGPQTPKSDTLYDIIVLGCQWMYLRSSKTLTLRTNELACYGMCMYNVYICISNIDALILLV
jgi:hypothetical protein